MKYPIKLGLYLHHNHPSVKAKSWGRVGKDGKEFAELVGWKDEYGPPPTVDDVQKWEAPAFTPAPPDPDRVPAQSLEMKDYKQLDAALENASTVAAVKAVFRAYLRKRAGLGL